eukprot:CAMPEP_0117660356 /NCGR_PEP_ID=MMETSP0804-20121206/6925_1 /TAXON_ID=1074897 /ORGANISM="Tetraselmis astigmatica, Strain CCMP880" /LENGTH=479 /DNA_ID=CAMNT_0005467081 /DNA_START=127 /DNA_END=1566 /DNA_ORIENTATION=+
MALVRLLRCRTALTGILEHQKAADTSPFPQALCALAQPLLLANSGSGLSEASPFSCRGYLPHPQALSSPGYAGWVPCSSSRIPRSRDTPPNSMAAGSLFGGQDGARWAAAEGSHGSSARLYRSSSRAEPPVAATAVNSRELAAAEGRKPDAGPLISQVPVWAAVSGQHFARPETVPVSTPAASISTPREDIPGLQPVEYVLPVIAYHIGMRLNFYQLAQSPEFVNCSRALNRDSIILTLPSPAGVLPGRGGFPKQYMVVFKYGSVVFFNVTDVEQRLKLIQMCVEFTELPVSKPQTEEYEVIVRPALAAWSELNPDHVILKGMDTNSIRVISSVLGQSVALDMYASKVDSSLETFSNLNREMKRTGTFTIRKEHLFRLVAENNIMITEIITKLGLLERSDTAWKYAQYGSIWEGMRAEFELDSRFQTLDLKINLIQDNVKYFLEILQNRKSDTLEWIIIVLIAAEIMLGLYDIFLSRTK